MRKTPFMPGEYYHIYNRTILGIPEFKEKNNCNRLTQAFLLSNSTKSTTAFQFLRNHKDATLDEALEIARSGEKLVDVLCYAIMPDHYHLLIREVKEKGATEFIRKSNISIAKYINKTKERKGTIFEGLFKSKHIDSNEYLLHASSYVNLNDHVHQLGGSIATTVKLVESKSSWGEYIDTRIKGICEKEIILGQFKNVGEYKEFALSSLESILQRKEELKDFRGLLLE